MCEQNIPSKGHHIHIDVQLGGMQKRKGDDDFSPDMKIMRCTGLVAGGRRSAMAWELTATRSPLASSAGLVKGGSLIA